MGFRTDSGRAHGSPAWRGGDQRPLVGVTADIIPHNNMDRAAAPLTYAKMVEAAGGLPVILQPIPSLASDLVRRLDAIVLTGGDDPRTEPFGVPTHPEAIPLKPQRQDAESALIEAIETKRPDLPVLGVCLGMQLMALHHGGRLDQHMPDTRPDAARHWGSTHPIVPEPGIEAIPAGVVASNHRQAVDDPGALRVTARADDGVIEAIDDPTRPFYLGVQWHAERTDAAALGLDLFKALVDAAREHAMVT